MHLAVFLLALPYCCYAVYLPPNVSPPPSWTSQPDVWRQRFNVTLPVGGWDGHWTQYRSFVRDLIEIATRQDDNSADLGFPRPKLPRQLLPIIYERLFLYSVGYGSDVPPSVDGMHFENRVVGAASCVIVTTDDGITTVICTPTAGRRPDESVGCAVPPVKHNFFNISRTHRKVDLFVLFDFGSVACCDLIARINSRKLLVFDSNIRLLNPEDKQFMTFVRTQVGITGTYDIRWTSFGLVHLTDHSRMTLYIRNSLANVWKVVHVAEGSTFYADRRTTANNFWIEALACDSSSLCLTKNVNVTIVDFSGEFNYVQDTYDFLTHFLRSNPYRLLVYELPHNYPMYYDRAPCPTGSNLFPLPYANRSICLSPDNIM